jgi:hypothetical protein
LALWVEYYPERVVVAAEVLVTASALEVPPPVCECQR